MNKYLLIPILTLLAVAGFLLLQNANQKIEAAPTIEEQILSSDQILTPNDLGIKKVVMHAQHGDDEVVVLRSKMEFNGKLNREVISYHKDMHNKIISIPMVEIKKNFFSTLDSYQAKGTPEFCDSVDIRCGGFSIEFDHLYASGANSSHSKIMMKAGSRVLSSNKNQVIVRFTERWRKQGRELKLTFTLEPMPYADALIDCPDLPPIQKNRSWVYQDAKYGTQEAFREWSDSIKRGKDGSLYNEDNTTENE